VPAHYIVSKFEIPFAFGLPEGIYVVKPEQDLEGEVFVKPLKGQVISDRINTIGKESSQRSSVPHFHIVQYAGPEKYSIPKEPQVLPYEWVIPGESVTSIVAETEVHPLFPNKDIFVSFYTEVIVKYLETDEVLFSRVAAGDFQVNQLFIEKILRIMNRMIDAYRAYQLPTYAYNLTLGDIGKVWLFIEERENPQYLLFRESSNELGLKSLGVDGIFDSSILRKDTPCGEGQIEAITDDFRNPHVIIHDSLKLYYEAVYLFGILHHFGATIILCHTATEVLIYSYCRQIFLLEGLLSELEINRKFEKRGSLHLLGQRRKLIDSFFKDMARTPFEGTSQVMNWEIKLYKLRNRIVHEGKIEVSMDEADAALEAGRNLFYFLLGTCNVFQIELTPEGKQLIKPILDRYR
jgi:hypothetical protein